MLRGEGSDVYYSTIREFPALFIKIKTRGLEQSSNYAMLIRRAWALIMGVTHGRK